MPRRFGFGLGFNTSRLSGLPEPSGFVAKYQAYDVDDFTLVTGSNVSQWDDRTTQTFGSELVTNGGFDTNSDWNYNSAHISIASGKCTFNGVVTDTLLRQLNVLEIGKRYKITFDVSDRTAGILIFRNPINTTVLLIQNNGSYSHVFTALDTAITFRAEKSFVGSHDNVSVKEVLTGANHLTQGTSLNQPKLTQDANRFNNKVDFGFIDFMQGLPPQSGDFTYVIKGIDVPADGNRHILFRNSLDGAFIQISTDGRIGVRVKQLSNNALGDLFSTYTHSAGLKNYAFVQSGNNLNLYVNGVIEETIISDMNLYYDLGLNNIGNSVNSINGSLQELYVYDRALTQDEIRSF